MVILAVLAVIAVVFGLSKILPAKHHTVLKLADNSADGGLKIEFPAPASGLRIFASACAEEVEEPAEEASETGLPKSLDEYTDDEILIAITGCPVAESYMMVVFGDYFRVVPLLPELVGQKIPISVGEEMNNEIEILENGFVMSSADCSDQICVSEGEVTLENREERILGGFVVCLPHNLTFELKTKEEMAAELRYYLAASIAQ